jgi:hypothetical protein
MPVYSFYQHIAFAASNILRPKRDTHIGNFWLGPAHAGVIGDDDVFWQATVHAQLRGIG